MAFQIGQGSHGTVSLDGLGFIVLLLTPEEMGKGNWSVGVIVDARASAEQRDAITSIASGSAGGPMAALSPLVGKFLGVESAPIRFDRSGAEWSVTAPGLVDIAAKPATALTDSSQLAGKTVRWICFTHAHAGHTGAKEAIKAATGAATARSIRRNSS